MLTTLHYADDLDTPRNNAFRAGYSKRLQDRSPTSTRCRATTRRSCSPPG